MKYNSSELLFTLDLAGTFVFAVEGAMAAIRGNLDFLCLMVLSFATALGGRVVRDLLIGAVPPGAIRDWRYSVVAFTGATTRFSCITSCRRFLFKFPSASTPRAWHYLPWRERRRRSTTASTHSCRFSWEPSPE